MSELPEALPGPSHAGLSADGTAPAKGPEAVSESPGGPVTARQYVHRALPGRVVVRVVEEAFGAAIDAEMALLGFERASISETLGPTTLVDETPELWLGETGIEVPAPGRPETVAWFVAQVVQLVRGGVTPWPGLLDDMVGIAERAGVEGRTALEIFAGAILPASGSAEGIPPALAACPVSFWVGLGSVLAACVARRPEAGRALLDLFPPAYHDASRDEWLTLLYDSGALAAIWDASAPAEAVPSTGRVEWFARLCGWARIGNGWTLQLARRAAATLANEGPPVPLARGEGAVDLDLLDLLSELSVPWVAAGGRLDLRAWARGTNVPARLDFAEEPRPRDPTAAARDPEVQKWIAAALVRAMGDPVFEEACRGSTLAAFRDAFLLEQITALEDPARVDEALTALEAVQHTAVLVEVEALATAFGAARIADTPSAEGASERARRLLTLRTRAPRPPLDLSTVDDRALAPLAGSATLTEPGATVAPAIRALGAFLAAGQLDVDIVWSRLPVHEWVGRVRALAWIASREGLTEDERQAVVAVLRAWVDAGLGGAGLVRTGRLRFDQMQSWIPAQSIRGEAVPYATWTAWVGDRRIVVLECSETPRGPWNARFIEWASRDAEVGDWPGLTFTSVREYDCTGDDAWIDTFCSSLARLGARVPSSAQVAAFAQVTGLTPEQSRWVIDAFPKNDPSALDLPHDTQLELLAAAVSLDPADLWIDGGTEALAAMWVDAVGKACPIPPEIADTAAQWIPEGAGLLPRIANPSSWPGLRIDALWEVTRRGVVRQVPGSPGGFDPSALYTYAQVASFLIGSLPVGDPLLVNLVKVHEQVRLRLANPQMALAAGTWNVDPQNLDDAEDVFRQIDGRWIEVEDLEGRLILRQRRGAAIVATFDDHRLSFAVEPARLDHHTRAIVDAFRALTGDPQRTLRTWDLLRSEDYSSLLERAWRTPLGAGEWEQDPTRSAPHVVRIMARRHRLTDAAAALYLQTLVLLEPTRAAIRKWNRWSESKIQLAAEELVENELVVGRPATDERLFLPGERVSIHGHLLETWKLPLYGWDGAEFPLGRPLLLAPLHVLFARAWERCIGGHAPTSEDGSESPTIEGAPPTVVRSPLLG